MKTKMPAWLAAFPSAQVRDLDPRRHALIEASAGTGKTFAIEHLVLRLLVENPSWKPEEILLLSFTERTVADLRSRIRNLFRRQLRTIPGDKPAIEGWSEDDRARIHDVWLHADDLSVHTLHGFCQSTLLRDPIAHDALLRAEVADDKTVADTALENLLRGAWSQDPRRLEQLREALKIGGGENWRRKLISLALGWHPWREDQIVPDRDTGEVDTLERDADSAVETFFDAITAIEAGAFSVTAFRASFKPGKAGQEDLRKHTYNKVFSQAEAWRLSPPSPENRTESVLAFFKSAYSKAARAVKTPDGWHAEIPVGAAGNNDWRALAEACTSLRKISEVIGDARRIRNLAVYAQAAMELRAEFEATKIQLGRISYDDMPRNLAVALRRSSALGVRIARRYKACIVDEFQDTDPLQWEILQALCLHDAPAPSTSNDPTAVHRLPSLPLFLVGDPKQAIYAFRGGDLPTYLTARATFRSLATRGQAQGFGLEANFRSRPALIHGLNAVFTQPTWFGPSEEPEDDPAWHLSKDSERVHFTPAHAGRQHSDDAPGIILREFGGASHGQGDTSGSARATKGTVEYDLRQWIASRIVTLLEAGTAAKDIAVLVRKNNEGLALERVLRRRGIPCRIRKRGGAWSGPLADALRLLLEWIEDATGPDTQARILLLPFARTPHAGKTTHDDLPRGRPIECPPLITRWATLAHAGRWPEFFSSILFESGFYDQLMRTSPAEAEQFVLLTRRLGEAGSHPGTSVRALRERFDAWRRGEESDETDSGSADAADDAVSILTLHMSKGLEYPVVFLAAAGSVKSSEWYALRDPKSPGFRLMLDKDNAQAKAEHEAQNHEEDLRLFYVALTRAADVLYVPLLPESKGKTQFGPLGGFAADALRAAAADLDTAHLFTLDEEPLHDRSYQRADNAAISPVDQTTAPDNLKAQRASTDSAFTRRRRLTSYSRLAHRARTPEVSQTTTIAQSDPLLEDDGTRAQREEGLNLLQAETPDERDGVVVIADATLSVITATDLPPGAGAGTALHALLEHTAFDTVRDTPSPESWLALPGQRARIEEALRREAVAPDHAPAAARAVWNALRTAIPDPASLRSNDAPSAMRTPNTFRLADLPPENLRHEVEFLLPFGAESGVEPGVELPEGVTWKRSGNGVFLWGFIDLVFRHEGRYYLLDWKSNLLPSYDADSIARSMAQHRYDLQWKLYAIALDRWLAARLPDYEPKQHFGGVCYLYLRGASEHGPFSGYTYRPSVHELRAIYPEELAALLQQPGEETR